MTHTVRAFAAVAGLLFLFGGATACGREGAAEVREESPLPEKTIEQVLSEDTYSLMSLTGVVGTGQGECSGKPCIKVFVVRKSAGLLQQIPTAIGGYAVEIQETGEIKALDAD
jgi:hypothetical protein